MLNRIVIGLALLCLGQNVFAAKQEPLPLPLEPQLSVELILGQQEMAVDVPDSSAATAQFGLIGALVGSAIENAQVQNAEKRVVDRLQFQREVRNRSPCCGSHRRHFAQSAGYRAEIRLGCRIG